LIGLILVLTCVISFYLIVAGEGLHATGSPATTDLNSLVGHESEHHGGVPTFLVALPEQDIPHEVSKNTSSGNVGGKDEFDSEEIFRNMNTL
jgi:hypothetical protein